MKTEATSALLLPAALLIWSCRAASPPSPSGGAAEPAAANPTDEAMANRNSGGGALPESIGSATMTSDGTIVLQLRVTDGTGTIGDGLLRYTPGHPDYQKVLGHLGGLAPGDDKPVPHFPEKW